MIISNNTVVRYCSIFMLVHKTLLISKIFKHRE